MGEVLHCLQVEEALALGGDPNRRGHDGSTPLMHAAREGHQRVAGLLLALAGLRPNEQDSEGDTALSHACCAGSLAVVRLLVGRQDTDINTGDSDGVTPLQKAIANSWGLIVGLLLDQPGGSCSITISITTTRCAGEHQE